MNLCAGLKALFLLSLLSGYHRETLWAQLPLQKTFEVESESEVLLDLDAAAPGTSWAEIGSEAAVLTLFVDGKYHQDVILFAGARLFTYRLMLGRFLPGAHSLRIEHNRKQSAPRAATVEVKAAEITAISRSHPEFQALALAPFFYARPNTIGRFSDAPVLMWYEVQHSNSKAIIRYSVILTNEDGGTQTNALMARWGRTTDIEWIYEARFDDQGRLTASIFQGKDHEDKLFQGKKEADHPLFIVASNNNIFSDEGRSEMRFALRPIPFDLSRAPREELMYQNPWIYRLMADELKREGKIDGSDGIGQQIADPRRYLYIQAAGRQQDTAMSFAVKLKSDPHWYTSDFGINYYKIERNGYFQTTVRLPAGATIGTIEKVAVRCDAADDPHTWKEINKLAGAGCELSAVNRVFMLNENYEPGSLLPVRVPSLKLHFGDMIEIY